MPRLTPPASLDDVDRAILEILMADGRVTWAKLASSIGLTAPAAAERVRRLEALGVVRRFVALVDPVAVGKRLLAYTWIAVGPAWKHEAFVQWARDTEAGQEFHTVAGDFDYLLKIRCESAEALEEFLRAKVRNVEGIRRTSTTIVLSSPKETPAIPLP